MRAPRPADCDITRATREAKEIIGEIIGQFGVLEGIGEQCEPSRRQLRLRDDGPIEI